MSNEDKIKELFAEKLGAHEAPVNPELWNAIASQIGTSAAVTSTGLSVLTKAIIGISAASVIGLGTYLLTRNSEKQPQQQTTQLNIEEDNHREQEVIENSEETQENLSVKQTIVVETSITRGDGPPKNSTENDENNNEKIHSESLSKLEKLDANKPIGKSPTNESTPILTGEKASPAPTVPTQPKVNEKKEPKVISNKVESADNAIPKQEEKPSFELTELPNIYGLNASGYFSIGYKGEYSDFQLTIMDNNHNVIFRSDRPDFEWRGTDLYGNQIEPGKYVYIITAKDKNGKAVNKYSSLTVINQ